MKLTQAQRNVLDRLSDERWRSAYDLSASLNTLKSLRAHRLVRSRSELGYMAFPRNNIEWQITEHGKAALHD